MLEKYVLRPVLTFILKICFRVELRGVEHYHAAGDRVLIIANHVSFLDPLIIATLMPEKPAFAINVFQADKWFFRWLDKIATLYRLDPSKPMSMKRVIQDLRKGAKVVIFPEGRISTTSGLMKIYDGTGMIVEKTGATVLPVRVDGAEFSKVSRMGTKMKTRWFPTIRVTILPPKTFPADTEVPSRAIYDLMTDAAFMAANTRRPILDAVLEAQSNFGAKHIVGMDVTRTQLSYRAMFTRAFVLGAKLHPMLEGQNYVALMLPSSLGAIVTFTALHSLGKIPCMLNFSAGASNIMHACKIATVKTVLTSRAFIEQGKLQHLTEALEKEYKIIYLEDIKPTVTLKDKLTAAFYARIARSVLQDVLRNVRPDDPAVILYTSGSEGTPKGVALSHANILSNIHQAIARLDLNPSDILFNAMPVFHSFGLTVGMILPLVKGLKTFMYPTPLHYRVIPELAYDCDATILIGTDTFYNGYAHYAHPYDFFNIRLAVAGAEKLKDSTRRLYLDKFGVTIYEGYGVTESSPVVAVNTPLEKKIGSVGRMMPLMQAKTEKIEGLEGGRLYIKGPNVMLGYLKADQPGVIQPQGEWYDTGDIVDLDADNFITILGRAKRFAKIAGEMVSLQSVEDFAHSVMSDAAHAAIAIPDDKKGEQVVLYTEAKGLERSALVAKAKEKGVAEICLPKKVIYIESIPRLGTGKVDYPALSKLNS